PDDGAMAAGLCAGIRPDRIQWRGFPLWDLGRLAKDLGGRRLAESNRPIDGKDRVQAAFDSAAVERHGELGLGRRCAEGRDRGEIVDFLWSDLVDDTLQTLIVHEVGWYQRDPVREMSDAPRVVRRAGPCQAKDVVSVLQQQLSEVRAVLPGNARHECAF